MKYDKAVIFKLNLFLLVMAGLWLLNAGMNSPSVAYGLVFAAPGIVAFLCIAFKHRLAGKITAIALVINSIFIITIPLTYWFGLKLYRK